MHAFGAATVPEASHAVGLRQATPAASAVRCMGLQGWRRFFVPQAAQAGSVLVVKSCHLMSDHRHINCISEAH